MIGRTISHYSILETLGAGGMGVVYKATEHMPQREIDRLVADSKAAVLAGRDSEPLHFNAEILAYCGKNDDALDLLKVAVDRGRCDVPEMDDDPAFAAARKSPRFQGIRQRAVDCQARFLKARTP